MRKFSYILLAILGAFNGALLFAQIPYPPYPSGTLYQRGLIASDFGFYTPQVMQPSSLHFNVLPQPITSPTASAFGVGVLTGTYYYAVTCGNTLDAGMISNSAISAGITVTSNQVQLTSIPICSDGAILRNIYRTASNAQYQYQLQYLATINDNITTTYIDDTPDVSLGTFGTWVSPYYVSMSAGQSAQQGQGTFFQIGDNSLSIGYGEGNGYASLFIGGDNATNSAGALRDTFGGLFAGQFCTSCTGDAGWGVHALQNDATGASNASVGYSSCVGVNGGTNNLCFGGGTLAATNSSSNNMAFGGNCLFQFTGGNALCIGFDAGSVVTTAAQPFFVGVGAGGSLTTGNFDMFIGHQTGNTGTNNCTTCSDSLFVGYQAGLGSATQVTNSMVFGFQAKVSQNNYVQFGNSSVNCLGVGSLNWCSGSGAPSGACVSGSLYSNTSGTSSGTNNLYVCSQTAWIAVK